MEYNCANCLYSTKEKREKYVSCTRKYVSCTRIVPVQISKDPNVMEYILQSEKTAFLAVQDDFLCNRWKPKE